MKYSLSRLLILLTLILSPTIFFGQDFNIHNPITLPDKSPESFVRQHIGYTEISILYHSPGARGRVVWGGVIPYGEVWRAGANENTIFTISHDVEIEGQKLAAGTYGLHLLPEEKQWTFIFSKNHTSWGSYFYDPAEDALRIKVPAEKAPENRDWMAYEFHKKDRGEASVYLSWAGLRAGFDLSIDIDQIALENIRNQLRSDAYWEWFSWCQAADYCVQYKINTKEALEWIDRSIAMQENFSNLDVKAKLLRQLGKEKAAQKTMVRAVEVGTDVYLERYGRRLMRQKDYKQAEYVFSQALKKNKNYWRAHFNRGNALEAMGENKAAQKAFKAAFKAAPDANKASIEAKIK